eukprot:2090963-Rhodomonas_salina.1
MDSAAVDAGVEVLAGAADPQLGVDHAPHPVRDARRVLVDPVVVADHDRLPPTAPGVRCQRWQSASET